MPDADAVAARASIVEKLDTEHRSDLADRLRKCGQPLRLRCDGCQASRDVMTRCDLKWCPTCQRALAARTAERYAAIAADCHWPLFVTFTVKHGKEDPVELIRHVRRAHTKLRRLRWWKRAVVGGVVAYEITHGENGWHPHAHALIDCRWLSVTTTAPPAQAKREEWARRGKAAAKEVAEQWQLCLGRKGGLHVRRCWTDHGGGIGGAVHEVLKYSVKGSDLAATETEIGPMIDVLDRTRLVASWGSFYRHPATKRKRSAPSMCGCGCTAWLPEEILERRELFAARKNRRR
jgi:hypothetical protein